MYAQLLAENCPLSVKGREGTRYFLFVKVMYRGRRRVEYIGPMGSERHADDTLAELMDWHGVARARVVRRRTMPAIRIKAAIY